MKSSGDPLPVRGYSKLVWVSGYFQSSVLLLCRLAWGWNMYLSGYRHLHDVPTMVDRFKHWGIPFPTLNVYMSGTTEMVGGILLMLGLATRLISIPLVGNFLVAILTAGAASIKQLLQGGQITDPQSYPAGRLGGLEAITNDTAFPFLMISALLLAFGPGKASIDYLLKNTLFRKPTENGEAVPVVPAGGG